MVSARTVQLLALPKASACLRSSSSAAGTKWFQLRKVSSRFWAYAGGLPRASQEAIPAVAPAAVRRNRRRGILRGAVRSMKGLHGGRESRAIAGTLARVSHPLVSEDLAGGSTVV